MASTPPHMAKITPLIRKVLNCKSTKQVKVNGVYLKRKDQELVYHDLYHLEVANLERIQIGRDMVSGIHGLNVYLFHDSLEAVEYEGILDEIRVAYHECLTRPSLYRTLKLASWMVWLMTKGINPFAVLIRHLNSLKSFDREAILKSMHLDRPAPY